MMNRLISILMVLLSGIATVSCNEFAMLEKAEGYLSISLQSDDSVHTKAAEAPAEGQVFSLGIYKGDELVDDFPDHRVFGRQSYVADNYRILAASGPNRPAVWDTPLYYGETKVKIMPNRENTATVICKITNVLVSAEFDEVFVENIPEYSLVVDNGEAALTFSEAEGTLGRTAYFAVTGKLNWELSFKNKDGKTFSTSGSYTDVKSQQHYRLKFSVGELPEITEGSAGIRIIVDDSINPAKEFEVEIPSDIEYYPDITTNEEFDITKELSFPAGDETPKVFSVKARNGISRLILRQKAGDSDVLDYSMWYDLVDALPYETDEMKAAGIAAEPVKYGDSEVSVDITRYVSNLGMGKYVIEAAVYDMKGQKKVVSVRLNVTSNVDAEAYSAEPGATTARITARWFDNTKPAGLGFEYRALGADSWVKADASAISYDESVKRYSAVITGLTIFTEYEFRPYSDGDKGLSPMKFSTINPVEAVSAEPWGRFAVVTGRWTDFNECPSGIRFEYREAGTAGWRKADQATIEEGGNRIFIGEIRDLDPGVRYEFRANSDGAVEDRLNMMEFTTESAGTVYNLSFDDWHQVGKNWYPFAQNGPHVWDSANEGATKAGNSTTTPEENDVVSGKAVKMVSTEVLGNFAAGNLYTGDFGEAIISLNPGAILDWGVEFYSRPLALKGYYKYSPVALTSVGSGVSVKKGDPDRAQIQIALFDWEKTFTVNTQKKQFVDFNGPDVIAYGKLESEASHDGYVEFTIPLEYRSLSKKPTYIVISACASYLGDYFTGGKGSTLWVDEFSLEYDPENLTEAEREKVNYR